MTPDEMAALHAAAFAPARGWSPAEISALCASPHVHSFCVSGGFALIRTVAGEAEVLTLAVDPALQRQGIADRLMRLWMTEVSAQIAYLEVAADNRVAVALYTKHGFVVTGHRRGYYARDDAPAVDAMLMQATLTRRQNSESQR